MLKPYRGVTPIVAANAFIEDTAMVIGDVVIGIIGEAFFIEIILQGDWRAIPNNVGDMVGRFPSFHGFRSEFQTEDFGKIHHWALEAQCLDPVLSGS